MMFHSGLVRYEREPDSLPGRGSSPDPSVRPGSLHDRDFYAWTQEQAGRLRSDPVRFASLDVERLAEEIEDLGSSQRSEIESRLAVLLTHLLKWAFQPEARSNSWRATVAEQRLRIARRLRQNPSLRAYPAEILAEEYLLARLRAVAETELPPDTFPSGCPFTIEEILDPDFLPEAT